MAFTRKDGEDSMLSEINVTPFVDVMLVLLIIFMVAAPMIKNGIQVDLPKAEAKQIEAPKDQNTVSLTKTGLFLNGKVVTKEGLKVFIAALAARTPDGMVLLEADKTVPYGDVAELMAIIRNGGITNLGMITEAVTPPPTPPSR